MYLCIWDDGSVSVLNSDVIPENLARAINDCDAMLVRVANGVFQQYDSALGNWNSLPDYSLSDNANRIYEPDDEDDGSYLDDEPSSVDLDPEEIEQLDPDENRKEH